MTPTARLDVDAVVRRAAVGLAAVAFAGSYLHVATFAAAKGQHLVLALVIAAMPEVSVAVCILRLRSGCTLWQGVWAGVVLASSVAFTVRANLGVTIPSDPAAIMVAVWPAWAAIGAAGLVEMRRHEPAAPVATRPATAPAKPATPAATSPATAPAKPATPAASADSELDATFPAGRGREAEQVAWFRTALQSFPSRTDKRWADLTGLSERTVQRRIDAAGGRPRGAQLGAPRLVEVGAA
jgi:hypothetical protein